MAVEVEAEAARAARAAALVAPKEYPDAASPKDVEELEKASRWIRSPHHPPLHRLPLAYALPPRLRPPWPHPASLQSHPEG